MTGLSLPWAAATVIVETVITNATTAAVLRAERTMFASLYMPWNDGRQRGCRSGSVALNSGYGSVSGGPDPDWCRGRLSANLTILVAGFQKRSSRRADVEARRGKRSDNIPALSEKEGLRWNGERLPIFHKSCWTSFIFMSTATST